MRSFRPRPSQGFLVTVAAASVSVAALASGPVPAMGQQPTSPATFSSSDLPIGPVGAPAGAAQLKVSENRSPFRKDRVRAGVFEIRTRGANYVGWVFDRPVLIRASGVVIRNSVFTAGPQVTKPNSALLQVSPQRYKKRQPSVLVEDTTFRPAVPSRHLDGVRGSNFTLRRVEISGTVDGVHIHGTARWDDPMAGNVAVVDSWIHDLTHFAVPGQPEGTHNDGVQVIGGQNIHIRGNVIDGAISNAAVMISGGQNKVYNIFVVDNWLGGGSCTVNVYDRDADPIPRLAVMDNTFRRGSAKVSDCAISVTSRTIPLLRVSNNRWSDNARPRPVPRLG